MAQQVTIDQTPGRTDPLVSVKMITYNHASHIRQAVEGVLNQKTDFRFELVIGEDCSTDGTRQIVRQYQQRFPDIVRIVSSDQNVGLYANSKRTHQACRGEYLAFCEGDDYWHDAGKLQRQVDHLVSHSDYVLVHSNYDLYFEKTGRRIRNALPIRADWDDGNAYEEILTRYRNVQTLTVLVRKSMADAALKANPECSDRKYLMLDLQLWLEVARLGKVKCLPESLATHNMLVESATHSGDPRKELRFAISVRDLVYHYVSKYECAPPAAQAAKSSATLFALSKAWKAGDADLARSLFKEHCNLRTRVSPHALLLFLGSRSGLLRLASKPLIAAYLAAHHWFPRGKNQSVSNSTAKVQALSA